MTPSTAPSSSSSAEETQKPSSLRLRAVDHESIVSAKPGLRKGATLPWQHVQFKDEVCELMSLLGVTIREASEWSGFTEKTIGKWRRGASAPDINDGRRFLLRLIRKAGEREMETGTNG